MLYYQPQKAMGNIIDTGSIASAIIAIILSSFLFVFITQPIFDEYEQKMIVLPKQNVSFANQSSNSVAEEENFEEYPEIYHPKIRQPLPLVGNFGWWFITFSFGSTLGTILFLPLLYVPVTILVLIFFEPLGSFGVVFRRDYGPLLTCTLLSWAATHLPFSLLAIAIKANPQTALLLWLLCKISFAIFMVIALRVVFSVSYFSALGTLSISWLSVLLQSLLFWMMSPFIIFWVYFYLRGDIGAVGGDVISSFRQRQSFRRNLEAATINPQDSEAHYQLGLIHKQRRQYSEATTRFQRAVEINKKEADAHFQLGIIAREQNRLQEAISYFDTVVLLDDKHSQSEVWREIGATYQAAGMNEDACIALEKYIERRPYDAEGLYYYGKVLLDTGAKEKAKEILKQCLEAVETAPYYRRGYLRRWSKLAKGLLKNLG